MSFANTFITLSDVDITNLSAGKFLRVRPSGNVEISQFDITTDTLTDIDTSGAYTPSVGQTLVYTAAGKFRPQTLDVYSAGNGINKSGLTLNVTAGVGGWIRHRVLRLLPPSGFCVKIIPLVSRTQRKTSSF